MHTEVFLTLGSNIAPEIHLPMAVKQLRQVPQSNVVRVSKVWESAPIGFLDQAAFCNAAVLFETGLSARELKFDVLRDIEDQLFRVRDPGNKNGPRTIDIDIALFGHALISEFDLMIPDPDIPEREFLAVPLAELSPGFVHPAVGKTLQQIADEVPSTDQFKFRADIVL